MNLYHYCSNHSFLSIIATKSIWASSFTLSNDHLEGRWIKKVVESLCEDGHCERIFLEKILAEMDAMIEFLGAIGVCLSEDGDMLSQWRAYSENGSGVAIGFDQSCFGEGSLLPTLQKVEYDLAKQKATIAKDVKEINDAAKEGAFAPSLLSSQTEDEFRLKRTGFVQKIYTLFPYLYLFKNPAFREEREWRSVTFMFEPHALSGLVDEPESDDLRMHRAEFRSLTDRIVPYKKLPLDPKKKVITQVVLGPRNITPINVIKAALIRHGWSSVEVIRSDASYR